MVTREDLLRFGAAGGYRPDALESEPVDPRP